MKAGYRPGEELERQTAAQRAHQRVVAVLGIAALLLMLFVAREPIGALLDQSEAARAWVLSFGSLAPLAYIFFCVMQILLAPIPGHFMSLMGGYLFGAVWGSLYSMAGLALGAGLAAGIARRLGRPLIERLAGSQQLQVWERRLHVRSPITWWLLFLLVPLPDAVYYVAGLSAVRLRWLVLAVVAGRGPILLFENWLGARSVEMPPLLLLGLMAVAIASAVVAYRYQRRLRLLALVAQRRGQHMMRRQTCRGKSPQSPHLLWTEEESTM
jgi:uncharacterized membrane protein YdjX (TVP38/TMEM64 family)